MSILAPVIDYIDPLARRIYLLAGVTEYHPVSDIYVEVRALREATESLRPYDVFVTAGGNLPKNLAGTSRTPRFAIFHNCQVVVSGDTFVSGEQLFSDANGDLVGSGKDVIDRVLSPADAFLDYAAPEAEVIVVNTGSGVTAQDKTDIAVAVRTELNAEMTHLLTLQNGLNANEATMLLEIYKLYGLDPTAPLVVTDTSRVAGDIVQTINSNATETTVTRP